MHKQTEVKSELPAFRSLLTSSTRLIDFEMLLFQQICQTSESDPVKWIV